MKYHIITLSPLHKMCPTEGGLKYEWVIVTWASFLLGKVYYVALVVGNP